MMFSRIHSRLGTAGLVVAVVALVAALCGAAFAAGGLTKPQEKQVKKLIKQYSKPGKPGPVGPQGAQGAQGPQGAAGAPGAKGATGSEGKQGKQGEPGEPGTPGEDGMCSLAKPQCVLPPHTSLTGTWVSTSVGSELTKSYFSISYPLRVVPAPESGAKRYISKKGSPTAECPGTYLQPKAEPGYLCIYAAYEEGEGKEGPLEPFFGFTETDPTSGSVVWFGPFKGNGPLAFGTWAVTSHCSEEEEEEEVSGC